MKRSLYYDIASIIRAQVTDPDGGNATRDRAAALARKLADRCKRGDPSFDYGWFFGSCGLDNWGELIPPSAPLSDRRAKWNSDTGDFHFY